MLDPDNIDPGALFFHNLMESADYWLFHGSTSELVEGSSIGCCITIGGDLEIYINREKKAVGQRNVPVDRLLWGVVIMRGEAVTIQSEFFCGELYSYNVYSVSHSCGCACTYISTCSLHIILKPVILQSHSVM